MNLLFFKNGKSISYATITAIKYLSKYNIIYYMSNEVSSYITTIEVKNKMRTLVDSGKYKSMNAIVTTGIKKILAEEGI